MEPEVHTAPLLRFGVFELDLRTGELRKSGKLIRLAPQPFRLLALLASRPGQLVTREEIQREIWGDDTVVDYEQGLVFAVKKVRAALADDSHSPRYIETLPRRGYRFIAPVYAKAPPASVPIAGEPAGKDPVSPASPRWRRIGLMAAGLAAVAAGLFVFNGSTLHNSLFAPALPRIHSIAVLPLQNLSGDKGQEYFAEGMTDELITDLGQVSALRVISRTSVMHYRQTSKTLPQIGRELGADAIVEGTVFRSGDRVRITAQLIDARNDRHLWAREYERDLRNVITLQDEVARDIADEVRVKLTPQERARLTASHPVNPEAHEAYLKGRYYWNLFTPEGMKRSLPFFQEAIAKDPNYALGYSGLADYYGASYIRFGSVSQDAACSKEEAAALKAVELDDSLGVVYYVTRQYKLAALQYRKTIKIDPKRAAPHWGLAGIYLQSGQFDLAKREYDTAAELSGDRRGALLDQADVDALTGKTAETLEALKRLKRFSTHQPVSAFNLAHVYTALGDKDHALAILVKAYESHDPRMFHLKVDPMFDSLHSDPRFQTLLGRMNFPK